LPSRQHGGALQLPNVGLINKIVLIKDPPQKTLKNRKFLIRVKVGVKIRAFRIFSGFSVFKGFPKFF